MESIPRASWESLFAGQGKRNPYPRILMIDGFDESWIDFESGFDGTRKGSTTAETVLDEVIRNTGSDFARTLQPKFVIGTACLRAA